MRHCRHLGCEPVVSCTSVARPSACKAAVGVVAQFEIADANVAGRRVDMYAAQNGCHRIPVAFTVDVEWLEFEQTGGERPSGHDVATEAVGEVLVSARCRAICSGWVAKADAFFEPGNWGSRGRRFKSGQPDRWNPLPRKGFCVLGVVP